MSTKSFLGLQKISTSAMSAAAQGFWLGLCLIWEPGPQNIYVFSDALRHSGWSEAVVVTTTASLCDTLLIAIAVFGLSYLRRVASAFQIWLMAGAGFYLVMLGLYNILLLPRVRLCGYDDTNNHFIATLLVSLPNLHAVAEIFGVIGGYSLRFGKSLSRWFGGGNILASWVWFWSLTFSAHLLGPMVRAKLSSRGIDYIGGGAMCFFGIVLLSSALRKWAKLKALVEHQIPI